MFAHIIGDVSFLLTTVANKVSVEKVTFNNLLTKIT